MSGLRKIREANYISRSQLAKAADVSASTIVRMEEGKTHTTQEVAEKVLKALSDLTGQTITINDIEGLNLYNIMRDRKQRSKFDEGSSEGVEAA